MEAYEAMGAKAELQAKSKRRGVGIVLGGHGGKGHGAGVLGVEVYSHNED